MSLRDTLTLAHGLALDLYDIGVVDDSVTNGIGQGGGTVLVPLAGVILRTEKSMSSDPSAGLSSYFPDNLRLIALQFDLLNKLRCDQFLFFKLQSRKVDAARLALCSMVGTGLLLQEPLALLF